MTQSPGWFGKNLYVPEEPGKIAGAPQGSGPVAPSPAVPPARIIPVGASLQELLMPYAVSTWQRETRRKGDASIYSPDISPDRPIQFSAAGFQVPKSMALFITMVDFRIFTFSGIGANDTVEVDPGNLSTSLGFDFSVGSQQRPFNAESEITPLLVGPEDAQFQRTTQSQDFYRNAALSNQSSASGVQKGLLPFDSMRPGSDVGPLTVLATSQMGNVVVRIFVFQPLNIPVSFFQVKLAGYLTNQSAAEEILNRMRAL